eukprot:350565-Chlamydomonas_euryale.AAC.3
MQEPAARVSVSCVWGRGEAAAPCKSPPRASERVGAVWGGGQWGESACSVWGGAGRSVWGASAPVWSVPAASVQA